MIGSTRDRTLSAVIAIVAHLLLGVGLWRMHLRQSTDVSPARKEIWIPIGLEAPRSTQPSERMGSTAEQSVSSASEAPPSPPVPPPPHEASQPQAPSVVSTPRPTPTPARTESHTPPTAPKPATPAGPSEQEVADRVSQLLGRKKNTQGNGTAGSPESSAGSADRGTPGSSAGFSLDGRSIVGNGGRPVLPKQVPDIRGTVVVEIVVNAAGQVTSAKSRLRGTNVTDQRLIDAAIRAAQQTSFNAVPGAPDQRGTITYHFDVR